MTFRAIATQKSAENSEVQLALHDVLQYHLCAAEREHETTSDPSYCAKFGCTSMLSADRLRLGRYSRMAQKSPGLGIQSSNNVIVDGPPFATLCPVPIPGFCSDVRLPIWVVQTQYNQTGLSPFADRQRKCPSQQGARGRSNRK